MGIDGLRRFGYYIDRRRKTAVWKSGVLACRIKFKIDLVFVRVYILFGGNCMLEETDSK